MTTTIHVEPNDFKGDYVVLDRDVAADEDAWENISHPRNATPFKLQSNRGVFHIRGGYGRSCFYFDLDQNGEILPNSISRPEAAIVGNVTPTTLVLQTEKVTIDANGYPGKYLPNLVSQTGIGWDVAISGTTEHAAIVDMAFTVWNGSSRGASSVIASIGASGAVCCITPESGVGSLRTLCLRLSEIAVIPAGNVVQISGYDKFTLPAAPLTSANKTVIRGLDTELVLHGPTHLATFVVKPLESIAP